MATKDELTRVETALSQGDLAAALDGLLRAWRETPVPQLADLIDRLDEQLPKPELPKKPATKRQDVWLELASDGAPGTLGLLASTLAEKPIKDARARLQKLLGHPPDPRLGAALVHILSEVPFTSDSSRPFWTALFKLLPQTGDPRLLSLAEELPEQWKMRPLMRQWLGVRLASAVTSLGAKFPDGPPEAGPELLATIERLEDALAANRPLTSPSLQRLEQDIEALYAEVYEHPDDDDVRQVLADLLQDKGDPRGEFITLQLLPKPSRAQKRRAKALVKEHGRQWLGPLDRVIAKTGVVFERGFLTAARVMFRDQRDVEACGSAPEWATVEEIELRRRDYGDGAQDTASMHIDPAMRSLRVLRGLDDFGVDNLCSAPTPWRLESLSCRVSRWASCEALKGCHLLPELTTLELGGSFGHAGRLEWLWETPFAQQLTHLTIQGQSADPGLFHQQEHLSVVTIRMRGYAQYQLVYRRDQEGLFTRLELTSPSTTIAPQALAQLSGWLEGLPDHALTEVRVNARGKQKLNEPFKRAITEGLRFQRRLRALELLGERQQLEPPTPTPLTTEERQRLESPPEGSLLTLEQTRELNWVDQHLIAAAHGADLLLLNADSQRLEGRLVTDGRRHDHAFSPARDLAALSEHHLISLWDVATHRALTQVQTASMITSNLTFTPAADRLLALTQGTGALLTWDIPAGTTLGELWTGVSQLACAPTTPLLACSRESRSELALIDLGAGDAPVPLEQAHSPIRQLVFSPDGALLATASMERSLELWEVASRSRRWRVEIDTDYPLSLAFSPDGAVIALGAFEGTTLFDTGDGARRAVLKGRRATFSADGEALATDPVFAEQERRVRVFELASGRELRSYPGGHPAFAPVGQQLAYVGPKGLVVTGVKVE